MNFTKDLCLLKEADLFEAPLRSHWELLNSNGLGWRYGVLFPINATLQDVHNIIAR